VQYLEYTLLAKANCKYWVQNKKLSDDNVKERHNPFLTCAEMRKGFYEKSTRKPSHNDFHSENNFNESSLFSCRGLLQRTCTKHGNCLSHIQLATSVLSFTSSKEEFNPIIFPVLALFRACDFCKMNEMRSKFVTNTKQRTNVRSRHSDS